MLGWVLFWVTLLLSIVTLVAQDIRNRRALLAAVKVIEATEELAASYNEVAQEALRQRDEAMILIDKMTSADM